MGLNVIKHKTDFIPMVLFTLSIILSLVFLISILLGLRF